MNAIRGFPRHQRRALRQLLAATGLAGAGLLMSGPALAGDAGTYCQQQWPADHDAYSLCQQLQDRNRSEFHGFLHRQGLNEAHLAAPARAGNRSAQIAQLCLHRWRPNYQQVWYCTKQHLPAAKG